MNKPPNYRVAPCCGYCNQRYQTELLINWCLNFDRQVWEKGVCDDFQEALCKMCNEPTFVYNEDKAMYLCDDCSGEVE